MTAVTQGYISPVNLEPNKIFYPGLPSIEKNNNHILRKCSKTANTMDQPRSGLSQNLDTQLQQRSNEYSQDMMGDDISSFFDFEPQTNPDPQFPTQYPPPVNPSIGSGWNNTPFETLSPPDSAIFAPEEWPPYQVQPRQAQNIVTNVYPNATRMQYGQTTPPDDEDSSIFEYKHKEPQRQAQPALISSVAGGKKRKRTSAATNEAVLPPKRNRKNAARSSLAQSSDPLDDPNNPENVRRSKFLERNRVAASKCRQKKKEWTSNLETRARELQKNNSSLRMMLGSLKDEVLWLKGEMLKHTSCGCEQIQSLMKQRAGDFAEQHEAIIKKEQSPIGSAPHSRTNSLSMASDIGTIDEATSPTVEGSPPQISPKEHGLEALLTCQFVHDTNDEGIAQQVRAAE